MTALLLSIVLNSYLGVAFSIFDRYKMDLFQVIVYNYWTCVITGTFVLGEFPIGSTTLHANWFPLAILMGTLFIVVFNLIAISSVRVGVTITQTANKLSFIIPVLVSFFMYQEEVNALKIVGIAVALLAVFLTTAKNADEEKKGLHHWEYFLPFILFIGSGIIDTLTKYVQRTFITTTATANAYLISGFLFAAVWGTLALGILFILKKRTFAWKNLLAGIILGVPNYFSIYYLIKALQHPGLSSTAIIPINNIGVLFLVSVFGLVVLKEHLSKKNYIGLGLTLAAIVLIFISEQ